MKISIYELLGLIKEGKAPKKIKYQYFYWTWTGDDYKTVKDDRECFLITGQEFVWVTEFLNDEVEVIEEKEIDFEDIDTLPMNELYLTEGQQSYIVNTINCLIKNQKKIIDVINDMRDKE